MLRPEDIEEGFVPVVRTEVVWEELDGEVVIYNGATKAVHVLDPIASVVWVYLGRRLDIDALAVLLADAFSADLGTVQADLLDMIRVLGRQGLLDGVIADPAAVHESSVSSVHGGEPKTD